MAAWPRVLGQNFLVAGVCCNENCLPYGGHETEEKWSKHRFHASFNEVSCPKI